MQQQKNVLPASSRHRRIGRKALQADRIANALKPEKRTSKPAIFHVFKQRPKLVLAIIATVVIISTLGFAGSQYYIARNADVKKTEAAKELSDLRAKSREADACRQKKVEEKSAMLGKITYDELYDYDDCNR